MSKGERKALAVYNAAVNPAGPDPSITTFSTRKPPHKLSCETPKMSENPNREAIIQIIVRQWLLIPKSENPLQVEKGVTWCTFFAVREILSKTFFDD
jgi:hypothetical protein